MEFNFDFYSPEQALKVPIGTEKKIDLFIKRDDLIHPYISGNKWRKLKYPLQIARQEGKTHLVTFGGAWSNHLLATACAGAQFGFRTTGFVRGEQIDNPVLNLCQLFGMELRFVNRNLYRDKRGLFDRYLVQNPTSFFIDEGGYSEEAALGCEEMIKELKEEYDHIFVACGTGATLAGVAKGLSLYQPQAKAHGIPVLKGGEFIRRAALDIHHDVDFTLHCDYHFGGYAKTKPSLIDFIRTFCKSTGILIEPVYTGKLLFGVLDLIKNDYFNEGDRIGIIHTGGLTGFLGFQSDFLLDLDITSP